MDDPSWSATVGTVMVSPLPGAEARAGRTGAHCRDPAAGPRWVGDFGLRQAAGSLGAAAPVAQRIEHLTTDQKVGGSSASGRAGKGAGQSVGLPPASGPGKINTTTGTTTGVVGQASKPRRKSP